MSLILWVISLGCHQEIPKEISDYDIACINLPRYSYPEQAYSDPNACVVFECGFNIPIMGIINTVSISGGGLVPPSTVFYMESGYINQISSYPGATDGNSMQYSSLPLSVFTTGLDLGDTWRAATGPDSIGTANSCYPYCNDDDQADTTSGLFLSCVGVEITGSTTQCLDYLPAEICYNFNADSLDQAREIADNSDTQESTSTNQSADQGVIPHRPMGIDFYNDMKKSKGTIQTQASGRQTQLPVDSCKAGSGRFILPPFHSSLGMTSYLPIQVNGYGSLTKTAMVTNETMVIPISMEVPTWISRYGGGFFEDPLQEGRAPIDFSGWPMFLSDQRPTFGFIPSVDMKWQCEAGIGISVDEIPRFKYIVAMDSLGCGIDWPQNLEISVNMNEILPIMYVGPRDSGIKIPVALKKTFDGFSFEYRNGQFIASGMVSPDEFGTLSVRTTEVSWDGLPICTPQILQLIPTMQTKFQQISMPIPGSDL